MSARGALTVRACSKCRKKKRKCDGQHPCSNCQARQEPCNYSVKEWTSKDGLRSEIQELKRRQESTDTVLDALRSPSTSGIVLEQLQRGDSVAKIEEKVLGLTSRIPGAFVDGASSRANVAADGLRGIGGGGGGGGVGDVNGAATFRRGSSSASSSHPSMSTGQPFDVGMIRPSISPDGMSMAVPVPVAPGMLPPMKNLSGSYTSAGSETSSGATSPPLSRPHPKPLQQRDSVTSWPPPPTTTQTNFDQQQQQQQHQMRGGPRIFSTAIMEYHLNLLFSWECPPLTMIDRAAFLADFVAGRDRYCSTALEYAIVAVSTRLTDALANRGARTSASGQTTTTTTQTMVELQLMDHHHHHNLYRQHQQEPGRLYFDRGLMLLSGETQPMRLPDVQALGLLSLFEVCNGNEGFARVLAERCLEATMELLRRGTAASAAISPTDSHSLTRQEVAETYAGAYTLASILKIVTYSQPGALRSLSWQPWLREDAGGRTRKFSDVVFDLTCIIGTTMSLPESKDPAVVLGVYEKCLEWYNSALGVLRDAVAEGTPSSLFLHMYYHFYLGVLFRPLADQQAHDSTDGYDFDITSGPSAHMMTTTITTATGDRASPRTICTESAHAVIALAQSFRRIHTLRRTPAFLPYFVYAAGLMLLEQDWIEARGGATNDAAAVDGVDGVVDGMDGVDGGAGGAGAGSGRGSSSSGSQIGGMSRDSVQSAGVAMALAQLAEMARTHPAAAEALEDLRSKDMNGKELANTLRQA
ncbi:hypothetical protein MCOR21_010389 [Pyricularia oryzae]|nr:hypothetical protein MCOR28_008499 [Pyricularia oryzae]KAI6398208.1 hypothetical protein MCOR20_009290 [Pyricularia oryzae]KAI6419273.1 hypothetical protein MCOR21_010389 [Pyricularia oryzae]KAI6599320.1 hypothetical protein MCOR06_001288 [Pyricularia oryzae]